MGLNMVGAAVVVPDASDGTEPENPYDGNKQTQTIRSSWKDEDAKQKYAPLFKCLDTNLYSFQMLETI